jgi:hypothetical protein
MAKVIGPLLSVDARGKLANAMVFMGWKGLKTVRQFVVPANPNTDPQKAVRATFTTAVGKHHLLLGPDKVAWDARASGQQLSGFNLFMKKVIDCLNIPKVWALYTEVEVTPVSKNAFTVGGISDNAALVKIKYGVNSGSYPYELGETAGRVAPGAFTVALTGLLEDTMYFFMVDIKTADGVLGESGEFTYKTPAV